MTARIIADQRRQAARTTATAANKQGPSNHRRRRQPRQRIEVKNIEARIQGRSFKIRNIDFKKMVQLFVK